MEKVALLFGLMLFAGLCGLFENGMDAQKYQPANPPIHVEKCETVECIEGKIVACEPAEMNLDNDQAKLYMKVKGRSSAGDCIVYLRLDEISSGAIPEEYQMFASGIKGADMTCALSQSDIKFLQSGEMPDKQMLEKCDGPLKSVIQLAISAQQ